MRPTDPHFDDSDDLTLVTDMMAGNREAFAELFRRHRDHVFRFARQMGGSPEMADDVTQDVFIAFIETGERFDPARLVEGLPLRDCAKFDPATVAPRVAVRGHHR